MYVPGNWLHPRRECRLQSSHMAGIKDITNVWNNVKEIDLRPLREQAERVPRLVIVGRQGSGRHRLVERLRCDPSRPDTCLDSPVAILELDEIAELAHVDLIVLMLGPVGSDESRERSLAIEWANRGLPVLIYRNAPQEVFDTPRPIPSGETVGWVDWKSRRVVTGPLEDDRFMTAEFARAVIQLLPNRLLALGRYFPLLRVPVVRHLINETSFSNAGYSLSTGIAEIVPVFDLPLNVADVIVLTKSQAFLVYKVGLALGLSTEWGDYLAEFGSVLGGGFLWRQIARQLVGLIPAWGIVPKVAVAYAGTYVVGNVVLQWYLTGKHVTRAQMRRLYSEALARGKHMAQNLASRLPRPRLRRKRREAEALPEPQGVQVCPNCAKPSAADASFCQYCGQPLPGLESA